MADKKLNSVSSVTDAAYVYSETSNGETVKISKADLASVVAGIIGQGLPYRGVISTLAQFNSAKQLGTYRYGGSNSAELGTSNFGIVIVFPADSYIAQIMIGSYISSRASYDNGQGWTEWKSMTI